MCGATSYRNAIARDGTGSLRPTGLYQCSGCSVVFADPKAWREGGEDRTPPAPVAPSEPSTGTAEYAKVLVPGAPDFRTYGLCPDPKAKTGTTVDRGT